MVVGEWHLLLDLGTVLTLVEFSKLLGEEGSNRLVDLGPDLAPEIVVIYYYRFLF